MTIKRLILIIIVVLILFGPKAIVPAFSENIKVGVILPLSGKLAKFGEIEEKSFLMAVEEINASGGIKGKMIDIIIEDTAGEPATGRLAVESLILQEKVLVLCGGCSSSVTWEVKAVAQEQNIPFLINTASADKLTESEGEEYIFRLNTPISEHLKSLASFLDKVALVKTVAIIYEETPFGQFGLKRFLELRKKMRLKLLMKEPYKPGTVDFAPLLFKVKAKNPDLIYMISNSTDASLLMQQAEAIDLKPKLFAGRAPGFTSPEFYIEAGDAASEYIYSTVLWTPALPYPGAKEFYARFFAKYGFFTDYHGAQAYAAIQAIADALERAESLTPNNIRDALAETDMMTLFGPVKFISYDKKRQQNMLPAPLVQWINGRLETVWPVEIASDRYRYPVPEWHER